MDRRQIRHINDYDKFKQRIEKKYGHKVVDNYSDKGYPTLVLDNGDEVRVWDDKKLIGNPFGRRGKDNRMPSHFTKTKYSEFGYKVKGSDSFEFNYIEKMGAGTLARAQKLGLTPAQIKQAEKDGAITEPELLKVKEQFGTVGSKTKSDVTSLKPWEMTREEFRDVAVLELPSYEFYKEMGWPEGHHYDRESAGYRYSTSHLGWVKTAIHKGKHVPDDIIKAYPELLNDSTIRVLHPGVYKRIETILAGSKSELQSTHNSRSELSKSSDERQEHSLVVETDDPRVTKWLRDAGSMDVRGIDTPVKAKRKSSKSIRRVKPTSLTTVRRVGR